MFKIISVYYKFSNCKVFDKECRHTCTSLIVVNNDIHLAMLYTLHVCILLFLFVFSHTSTCVNVDIITPMEGIAKRS